MSIEDNCIICGKWWCVCDEDKPKISMKKLSKAQQKVIDALKSGDCFILHYPQYEHIQKVLSYKPFKPYPGSDFETNTIFHFYLSTFKVLKQRGLIKETEEKRVYVLA